MDSLAVRTLLLWIHALAGAGWVGAAACYLIAAAAVGSDNDDGRAFARRVAPAINGVGIAAAVIIAASGIINLMLAGSMRQFHFSPTFIAVLGAKIAIFITMFAVLTASFRTARRLASTDDSEVTGASGRLLFMNGAVLLLGGAALVLGLWLMGS